MEAARRWCVEQGMLRDVGQDGSRPEDPTRLHGGDEGVRRVRRNRFDRGFRKGREEDNFLMFHLTIEVDGVDGSSAIPGARRRRKGTACEALGGELPVEKGVFNLFVDQRIRAKRMLYRLFFRDGGGKPLT